MPNNFDALNDFLNEIANEVNSGQGLRPPADLSRPDLARHPELQPHFQELGDDIWVPRATEALRLLSQLKQRFSAVEPDPPLLVDRVRFDVLRRVRPVRDRTKPLNDGSAPRAGDLNTVEMQMARFSPDRFTEFSSYQVDGWQKVSQALQNRNGLVITAPTGAGKTEVFMLPLFNHVATRRAGGPYFLIYPRVELLKDQLSRALLFSWQAQQKGHNIPVGIQFGGVAADDQSTLKRNQIFDQDGQFIPVPECPVCEQAPLVVDHASIMAEVQKAKHYPRSLRCQNAECRAEFKVTFSRKGHADAHTPILLMTSESLERFYLLPSMQRYLQTLDGVIIDEAHLFEALYGVHVHQLLKRVEELRQTASPITKIACSATIGNPQAFASKLFYGTQGSKVKEHCYNKDVHTHETDGLEIFITLQVPPEERSSAPLLIQTMMALGHGILAGERPQGDANQLQVTFIDSLDSSERIREQVRDAEAEQLWAFRTLLPQLKLGTQTCPGTAPAYCPIYAAGECWRGLIVGKNCAATSPALRDYPMQVELISSKSAGKLHEADAAVATPTLEVGVDDKRIRAIVQYGPPRSVASLTQRRGRAGRAGRDVSYTVMVLGDSANDHYALSNRHSLQESESEIPLNTDNLVLRKLHSILGEERRAYARNQTPKFEPRGTAIWIHEVLSRCPRLRRDQAAFLERLYQFTLRMEDITDRGTLPELDSAFQAWVDQNLDQVRPILNVRRSLQVLSEAFPATIQPEVDSARLLGERVLKGEDLYKEFREKLREINNAVSNLAFDTGEVEYQRLCAEIVQTGKAFETRRGAGDYAEHQRVFSFFNRLKKWLNDSRDTKGSWFLFSPPDDMKAVLQALFYFHHGIADNHICCEEKCKANIPYFIPDNYFTSLKPLLFERRDASGKVIDYQEESVNQLDQMFYPYRLAYRYDAGASRLTTLDTEHRLDWVSDVDGHVMVMVDLQAIGLETNGYLVPQQVPIKTVGTDHRGRQVVQMCSGCYRLHDLESRKTCCPGGELLLVKVFGLPVVQTDFSPHAGQCRPIAKTLCTATGVGTTKILGAEVEATVQTRSGSKFKAKTKDGEKVILEFSARYRLPLEYGISGRAVGWKVNEIARTLSEDKTVQLLLEEDDPQIIFAQVLDTATALLHRTIAAVTGVRLDAFQSAFDEGVGMAWVWEVYEGGAGLTELFTEVVRRDPLAIFQEMLKAVLCPIGTAEEALAAKLPLTDIFERARRRYGWPAGNVSLTRSYREAQSELARMEKMQGRGEARNETCSAKDGCPACLHGATRRNRDERLPSRALAGRLLDHFVVTLTSEEMVEEMINFPLLGTIPRLMTFDGDENRVLRF